MIWIAIAALSAITVAALVWPFLRRRDGATAPRVAYDLAVYRDQLAELDRDHERGLLSDEQRAAARVEVERRMLAAGDRTTPDAEPTSTSHAWPYAIAVAAPMCAMLLYLAVGTPWRATPSTEQSAEAVQRAEIAQYVERLAQHLRDEPDDARGWSMLGRSYALLARFADAIAAYERAEELAPRDADLLSRHAEAQIMADGGAVGEASRGLIDRALALDKSDSRARFYQALAEAQAGRGREALALWLDLERDTPPDAPWRQAVASRIERLARDLGLDPARIPGREPGRGGAAPLSPPPEMSEEDRTAMIRGMVDGLAQRLAREPNDAEGWARLGRSYGVLGEREKSRDAWQRAAELKPDDVDILAEYASSIMAIAGDMSPPPEFVAVASALLRLAPDDPDALWFAGIAARARGDAASATLYWRKLLGVLPAELPARADVARALEAIK